MKRTLFFLCVLISIPCLYAMEDEDMESAFNSDDDIENRNSSYARRDELIDEMNETTVEVTRLRIKAIGLEQILRGALGEQFELLKNLPIKMDDGSKKIKRDHIAAQLKREHLTPRQREPLVEIAMHLFELSNEGMVLSEAIEEMEQMMETIANMKPSKQQQTIKKDDADSASKVPGTPHSSSATQPASALLNFI